MLKGLPFSEEHKSKLSEAHKGKVFSEKHRKNLSEAARGRKHLEETKRKMSNTHKGHLVSEETREKISKSNKGRKVSEKWKKRLSDAKKGKPSNALGKHWKIKDTSKMSEAKRGEKCHLWRGGKMKDYPELVRIRKSFEYKLWRKSVFERDNYTCQKYLISGGELVAHHINNFADFSELRLAIDNGITLSKKAHDEFHKIYGKHNNTREQLEEFLKQTRCLN